jgi:hypothetical protein
VSDREAIIVQRATKALTNVVFQVADQMPTALGNVTDNRFHDRRLVCASFLESPQSETVDLCVQIRVVTDSVFVSADLVRGGSGEVFSETECVVVEDQDTDAALNPLVAYLDDQADVIIRELHAS